MSDAPTIEGYDVLGPIGAGGSGQVFEARDPRGRAVAVKVLREDADAVAAARLLREAELVREMRHPRLVQIHDAGTTSDGRPFLVMERVEGRTLAARLTADGPLAPGEAWATVREVAEALAHAHSHGVLHRDLTAANVLLDASGRAKLGDFGLARRVTDPALSQPGSAIGTPHSMAPEQWWGARVDERTDVYGLGAVLYTALTGAAPWEGEDPAELVHRVATAAPRPPRERGVELPPAVERFVARCLARRPEERPVDVAAFLREGDAAFGRRARRRIAPWIALAAPAVALGLMGYAGSHDPRAWILESGASGFAVIALWILAAAAAWRVRAARPFAPLAPALLGGVAGFLTNMANVERTVAGSAPELRFVIFNLGAAEASATWFLGAGASASVFALVAALELGEATPTRRGITAAAIALLAGGLALDVPALAVVSLLAGLGLCGAVERAGAALATLGAGLSLGVAALVRLFSEGARVYTADLGRAARAEAFVELDATRTALIAASLVAIGAVAALSRWRGVRAWPARRAAIGAIGAVATVVGLALPYAFVLQRRAALGQDLGRHLAVWAELDPPGATGAIEGRLGPTLQLGRRHVALDSERVMLTRALTDDAGGAASLILAQAIAPRLDGGDAPDLVVAADRGLPSETLLRALRAAYDVGARSVDLLVVEEPAPRLPPSAPIEARVVLPSDVRAVPVTLQAGPPPEARSVDALVAALVEGRAASLGIGE